MASANIPKTRPAPGPVNTLATNSTLMTEGDLQRARAAKIATTLPRALDQLHTGRAILECFIETIPDDRADDRYVLWAARDALDKLYSLLDPDKCGGGGEVAHG